MKTISILTLILIHVTTTGHTQEISDEQAFYFYVRLNHINLSTEMPNRNAQKPSNYITYFAKTFDKFNYSQKINDEFEKNDYQKQLYLRLNTGLNGMKFENQYTSMTYLKTNGSWYGAILGEYSFSQNAFPLNFGEPPRIMMYNDQAINFQIIGDIANKADFDFFLKMPMETAKEFISRRKDASGKIDRNVFVQFTYSVLNNDSGLNKDGKVNVYLHKIDVYADKQFTKLGTILPTFDWYDKIKGIRIKEGDVETSQHMEQGAGNSKDEGDKFVGIWIGNDPECKNSSTKVVVTKQEGGHYLIEFAYVGDCSDFDGYSCITYFYSNQNKLIGFQKDYNSEVKVSFVDSNKISIPLLAQNRILYLHR